MVPNGRTARGGHTEEASVKAGHLSGAPAPIGHTNDPFYGTLLAEVISHALKKPPHYRRRSSLFSAPQRAFTNHH